MVFVIVNLSVLCKLLFITFDLLLTFDKSTRAKIQACKTILLNIDGLSSIYHILESMKTIFCREISF